MQHFIYFLNSKDRLLTLFFSKSYPNLKLKVYFCSIVRHYVLKVLIEKSLTGLGFHWIKSILFFKMEPFNSAIYLFLIMKTKIFLLSHKKMLPIPPPD